MESEDRKSTRLNSSHLVISYAVFCLKKKKSARLLLRVPLIDLPLLAARTSSLRGLTTSQRAHLAWGPCRGSLPASAADEGEGTLRIPREGGCDGKVSGESVVHGRWGQGLDEGGRELAPGDRRETGGWPRRQVCFFF